ncbi:gluconokinase [uncultured Cohaesibacter sp.]|uniref:gluconokinase n=1 Tax=uncultured Cohaesibacter sp. TaxID=1002546 RepID=UPI0029C60FF5|nr:gluconokinase [uncultured Cohaesibacter sp.]
MIIVVMGISGSGKSTLGQLLAGRLNVPFEEGDAYHSSENVRKMAAGIPLTDADRKPWLESLARAMREWDGKGETRVLSCSSLRKSYRDIFRQASGNLRFIFLDGAKELVRARMAERQSHFMPVQLIESQIAALEVPDGEEDVIRIDISADPEAMAEELLGKLKALL